MPNNTCSVESCAGKSRARGWCTMHYQRWKKHGDLDTNLMPNRIYGTVAERFYPKVSPPDSQGCKLWTGALDGGGYGHFMTKDGVRGAHKIAYEMEIGPVPSGLHLDHRCHTEDLTCVDSPCKHRRCVNASHLEPVTQAENNRRGHRTPKTHCVRNHPFSESSTYTTKRGQRQCRECRREWKRERRRRQ
jgi:hypothetical protein